MQAGVLQVEREREREIEREREREREQTKRAWTMACAQVNLSTINGCAIPTQTAAFMARERRRGTISTKPYRVSGCPGVAPTGPLVD
jgi:hypothetical protein